MSTPIVRSTAETAGFIPQIWAQRALDILRANIVLLKLIARDTDYEPQPQGKTLTIPYPGTFTAQKKTQGSSATIQTPSGGSSVNVTLSELAYVDFVIEDFARVQASSELLDRYIEPAAVAIAEQMEADLFTLYSSMTGGSVGTSGTDMTPAEIRQAAKLLDDAKVPMSNRSLVISSKDRVALLGNTELTSYFAFARPEGVAQGSLGNLYGFETFMSQLVPAVAGTPVSTKNLALHKNAMILATRPLGEPEPTTGLQASSLVDNDSGIAIRVLRSYDMAARGHRIGFDVLYGYTPLRTNHGVIALS
jgi:hypothetical protein